MKKRADQVYFGSTYRQADRGGGEVEDHAHAGPLEVVAPEGGGVAQSLVEIHHGALAAVPVRDLGQVSLRTRTSEPAPEASKRGAGPPPSAAERMDATKRSRGCSTERPTTEADRPAAITTSEP